MHLNLTQYMSLLMRRASACARARNAANVVWSWAVPIAVRASATIPRRANTESEVTLPCCHNRSYTRITLVRAMLSGVEPLRNPLVKRKSNGLM